MSSYMYFALKNKDMVAPLECVCRSSELYQMFKDIVPYGKMTAVNGDDIDMVYKTCVTRLNSCKEYIESERVFYHDVMNSPATLEEKAEAYSNMKYNISEIENDLEDYESAFEFIKMLKRIYYNIVDEYKYGETENKIDPNDYIYIGIETGFYGEYEEE